MPLIVRLSPAWSSLAAKPPAAIEFLTLADIPPERLTTFAPHPQPWGAMQTAMLVGLANAARDRALQAAAFAGLTAELMAGRETQGRDAP